MVGTMVAGPTNGASRSACPMPFCKAATRVPGPQRRRSQGSLDAVSCALVHNSTQSWTSAGAGSVRTRNEASIVRSGRSTTSRPMGFLTQAVTWCWPAAWSEPAMMPPMLPRPTTAMLVLTTLLDDIRPPGDWLVMLTTHQCGSSLAKEDGRPASISGSADVGRPEAEATARTGGRGDPARFQGRSPLPGPDAGAAPFPRAEAHSRPQGT